MKISLSLFHHIEKTYRLHKEIEKCGIGLRLPKQPGQHFREKQCDRCFHRIAIDMTPHLDLMHIAYAENILPRLHFRIDFEKSERRKKRAQHTGTFSLRLRQQIGRPPETFGINLYDRHLIAVCNRMQYNTSCFFQHIWRKQAI